MSMSGSPSSVAGPAGEPSPNAGKPRAKGWLLAFAIAGIALGALDAFTGLSTAATPAIMRGQARFIAGMGDQATARSQTEMFEKTAAVYERHRTAVSVGAVGRTLVGVAMIIAGIGCIGLRRWGRKLLIAGFTGAAILAIGLAPEMVRLQREVAAESAAHFERAMRAAGSTAAGQQVTSMMTSIMRTTGAAATIGAIGIIVLMTGICVAGAIFLLHPRIRGRFEVGA